MSRLFLGIAILVNLGAGAQADLLDGAKSAVVKKLKDPESAKFADLSNTAEAVCGTVNGKNAFGGYPGVHRFYLDAVMGPAPSEG
jgi:hypothetical protein